MDEARQEAEQVETAGKEALRIATRDTILRFQQELMDYFNERVRRLVSEEMDDRETLSKLILEVAGRASREAGVHEAAAIEVLRPEAFVGIEDLKRNPDELASQLPDLVTALDPRAHPKTTAGEFGDHVAERVDRGGDPAHY